MTKQKAARRSGNYKRAYVPLVKVDKNTIAKFDSERARYVNFVKGGSLAAVALCLMFLVLSCGVVMFGW